MQNKRKLCVSRRLVFENFPGRIRMRLMQSVWTLPWKILEKDPTWRPPTWRPRNEMSEDERELSDPTELKQSTWLTLKISLSLKVLRIF